MWSVYILKCRNGDYYKGCTANLEERLDQHQKGKVKSTCENLPVELVCYISFPDKYRAYKFEKYLKSGSGRAFLNKHFI
jgi:predicted GIY-YIG superfamily endonuclease